MIILDFEPTLKLNWGVKSTAYFRNIVVAAMCEWPYLEFTPVTDQDDTGTNFSKKTKGESSLLLNLNTVV